MCIYFNFHWYIHFMLHFNYKQLVFINQLCVCAQIHFNFSFYLNSWQNGSFPVCVCVWNWSTATGLHTQIDSLLGVLIGLWTQVGPPLMLRGTCPETSGHRDQGMPWDRSLPVSHLLPELILCYRDTYTNTTRREMVSQEYVQICKHS